MGKVTGFLEIASKRPAYRPVEERLRHYKEFLERLPDEASPLSASQSPWAAVASP